MVGTHAPASSRPHHMRRITMKVMLIMRATDAAKKSNGWRAELAQKRD